MGAITSTAPATPGPQRDDWIDFLYWMVDERFYVGHAIVAVVEKPHQYGDEYAAYLAEGGAGR